MEAHDDRERCLQHERREFEEMAPQLKAKRDERGCETAKRDADRSEIVVWCVEGTRS